MAKQPRLVPARMKDGRLEWCVSVPPMMSETGTRQRSFFATKAEAHTFIEQTRQRRPQRWHGESRAYSRSAGSRGGGLSFAGGDGPPSRLLDIVQKHLERKRQTERSVSFSELRDEFLMANAGRSNAYGRQMRAAFARLDQANVAAIEAQDIDRELEGISPAARNGSLLVMSESGALEKRLAPPRHRRSLGSR
jgi:hypothetical protein